jgi:nucleoside-diphosphate-sugar epimerase
MRVLVTGANGCIGSWVVKVLLARGIDVLVYDQDPSQARLRLIAPPRHIRRLTMETGRIEDNARVKALVRDGGVTHIVHLAAVLMPFCQANPATGALVNVIGTLNIFEAARDAGRTVRIAYASSSAVWGPLEQYGEGPVTEDLPLSPSAHYGVFKQANEGSARVFFSANGISSIGLRPYTVYGVGRDTGLTADPTLAMRAAALGEEYRMRLTGYMDLQFAEDVAETFVRCLLAPAEGAFAFNMQGTVITMADLIAMLERLRPGSAGKITAEGPCVPVAYRLDDGALRSTVPDIPRTPLEDGVRRTVELFEKLRETKQI